jgi:hypothetical protein
LLVANTLTDLVGVFFEYARLQLHLLVDCADEQALLPLMQIDHFLDDGHCSFCRASPHTHNNNNNNNNNNNMNDFTVGMFGARKLEQHWSQLSHAVKVRVAVLCLVRAHTITRWKRGNQDGARHFVNNARSRTHTHAHNEQHRRRTCLLYSRSFNKNLSLTTDSSATRVGKPLIYQHCCYY